LKPTRGGPAEGLGCTSLNFALAQPVPSAGQHPVPQARAAAGL